MKNHDFLNLKMGNIRQYAIVIKKKDLDYWRNSGWLTYTEIGLPQGAEKVKMLYGNIKNHEILVFNRPMLLRDILVENLTGLEVKKVSPHLGTYGMGGAEFFGLLLDNDEYLTYAVWGSGNYIIIDNRVVECDPDLYNNTKPWLSNYGGEET